MARLPIPGQDDGTWGTVLNDFLSQAHASSGGLKTGTVNTATIVDGNVTKVKLSSGVQASLDKADTAAQPADLAGKADDSDVLKKANNLSDVANAATALSNLGAAPALAATPVKTTAFTASANQLVPADATSAAFTVTLPTAPADKSRVTVKKIDATANVVTVQAGGSDVFNKTGGGISVSLSLQNQAVSLQYTVTGAIWYVVSDDLPLSALNARYVPKSGSVVDIRDYVTSGTTFNMAAVVAAMEAYGGPCFIPAGDWTPTTYNIGLNDTAVPITTGTALSRFTYKFVGVGKSSRIMLPSGMSSGDYLLFANSANAANYQAHPKVIFEDMAVTGVNSPNGGFFKSISRSFTARRVYLNTMLNGFTHTGYSDLCRLEQVFAEAMTAGSWVFTGTDNGDGLVVDQLFVYGSGGINLNGCVGASIRGCISGWHQFRNCAVTFDENHFEGDGTTSATPVVTLKGCIANIVSGTYEAKKYRPTFSIDDESGTLVSRIVFHENVHLWQRFDDAGSSYGALKGVDIDIVNLSTASEITLHSLRSYAFWSSTALANGGGLPIQLGPLITASGMSGTIQTILTQYPIRAAGEFVIRYSSGGWEMTPPRPSIIMPTVALTSAFISASPVSQTGARCTTSLTPGTYYYLAWTKDVAARITTSSGETSVVTTSGAPVPAILTNTRGAPILLRILRGTASGVYTQYAQILITKETQTLFDQGTHIAGTAWSAYSGSPTYISTGGFGETRNGVVFVPTLNAEIYATAAPTQGSYIVGDRCWNLSAAAAGVLGWVCTTAGYPGTWKAMASLAA